METTETNEVITPPTESWPIGQSDVSETFCVPCNRDLKTKGGLKIHQRWQHDEEGRKIMLAGAKKGARNRTKKHKLPKLIGPNGKKVQHRLPDRKCSFCDYPPFNSESGLRYHLNKEHGIRSMSVNRKAAAKKFANPPKVLKELDRRLAPANGLSPKAEITRSEVMATIEVVRIGTEVYGRITSEVSAR